MTSQLKGKLVVGQSGGPTPVINASLAGVILAAQQQPAISGIYGLVHGIEGALKEELIDLDRESAETIKLLAQTPASALGSCRHKLKDEEYGQILELFKAHNVRYFVYIGGNDSMDTCHRVAELARSTGYDMRVMGVPKTMDNDLAHTDHCPGYGSAARFLALATRDTGRDLEAMATFDDVTILEALGRNAGWLTASAMLGKQEQDEAPHLVHLPEIPFDEGQFLANVSDIHQRLGCVFVVVSEGIRDAEGRFIGQAEQESDAFGHVVHSLTNGVAAYLTERVRQELGLQARFLRPSLIGRALSASISETDRQEALEVGQQAIIHLAGGQSGHMVTLERRSNNPYRWETGLAELAAVANEEKLVPRDYVNEAGTMPNERFVEYALPLIGGALPPLARLASVPVEKKLNS